jgi:hypothetical protein
MPKPSLLFVYNADSGLLNALKDMVHKVASPESYPCSLCATTYGAVAMRPEWKAYVGQLPYEAVFLHRDELRQRHPGLDQPLPAILIEEGAGVRTLIGPEDLPLGQSLEELTALVNARLAAQHR